MHSFIKSRKNKIYVFIFLMLSSFCNSFSQESNQFGKKGVFELGGNISYMSNTYIYSGHNGGTFKTFSALPYIGYFIADGFELGLNPFGVTIASFSGSNSVTQLRFLAAPSYNFTLDEKVFPFVEALFGYTAISGSGGSSGLDGFSWGGRGGLKCKATEQALLNIGVQYLEITTNASGASSRSGNNEFSVSAGITIWF